MLISCVVSLLAVATQALPIEVSEHLNNAAVPIGPSNPLRLVDGGRLSLMKRAVGATHMSAGPVGTSRRLDVVRRAVGTVADSAPTSAIHAASTLEKRSAPLGTDQLHPIGLPVDATTAPVVEESKASKLPLLGKRSILFPSRATKYTKPAQKSAKHPPLAKPDSKNAPQAKPDSKTRVANQPDTEGKWARARAW